MTKIWYVPIEPLDERYTSQWYRKLPQEFVANGFDVCILNGKPLVENEIKVGAFLDINSTVHYKMSQLQSIASHFHYGLIKDGDIFFFGDIEFWGIESVRLMARMNNIEVRLTGFLHAASYTKEDAFSVAARYQQFTELGWVAAMDKVFVGSKYHKEAFLERRVDNLKLGRDCFADKIVVTQNPLFLDEYHDFGKVEKKKKVLLTNRFDREKRPGLTLDLFEQLHNLFPDWEFVVTTGRKKIRGHEEDIRLLQRLEQKGVVTVKAELTKEQYHRELAESYMMVSHSIEENYGYCIVEAIHYKCIPILTKGLSHDELVTPRYQFDSHYDSEIEERMSAGDIQVGGFYKGKPVLSRGLTDIDVCAHWMQRFGEPSPVMPLNTSGMQNIINELKAL